jgi:hypothetical protein
VDSLKVFRAMVCCFCLLEKERVGESRWLLVYGLWFMVCD